MDKADFARVQALPCEGDLLVFDAVNGIPRDGMADIRHMNPDLVRSSRFENTLYVSVALVAAYHLIVGNG